MYEHLNLKAWPFQVVPDPDFAKVWAGRKQTRLQLDNLLKKLQLAPKSSINLLWANFGMGKTHTLMHFQHLCAQTKGGLIPAYVVMPNKPASFLDIYREIVAALPFEFLGEQLLKVGKSSPGNLSLHPMFIKSPGIVNALLAFRRGEIESGIAALQWLKAQPGLSAKDMHTIGVTYRIKTAEDAIQALTSLTKLSTFKTNPNAKLVILLDEFQRIGELKTNIRYEINAGLHAYFNANPAGLSIMLSFSFGKKENVAFLLSNEIQNRAEPQSINLDALNPGQAAEFLSNLLDQFHLQKDNRWFYPFSAQAVNAMIRHIAQKKTLTPRRIMLYAHHILAEHLINHPDSLEEISDNEAIQYLEDPQLGEMDMDNDTTKST